MSNNIGGHLNQNRNQILGIRTNVEFIDKFDNLCERLGFNRSEVIRYALKRFYNDHYNNPEGFVRVRKEMF
jgi:metal-responsive CopG/Arc/MetJ family transcriptional regulator